MLIGAVVWGGSALVGAINRSALYSATIPGPDCDHGSGYWFVLNGDTRVSCSPAGMVLTQLPNATHIAAVYFSPSYTQTPPENYTITLDVSALSPSTCVGAIIRAQFDGGAYGLYVCSDGFWKIIIYDNSSAKPTVLSYGTVARSDTYHLEVVADGNTEGMTINGGAQQAITDSTYMDTNHIGLVVFSERTQQGGTASATFSHFVYAPRIIG